MVHRTLGCEVRVERSGLRPGLVIVLCSWARHVTLTVPLFT